MDRRSSWMLAAVLAIMPVSAPAATVTATFANTIVDNGANGFDSINASALYARFLDTTAREVSRGVLEFALSSFAGGTSAVAALELVQVSFGSASTQGAIVYGYSGDGIVTLEDATAGTILLGQLPPSNTGNGPRSLDVSSFVSSLLASGASFAGFVLRFPIEEAYIAPFNGGTINISTNFTQWTDLSSTVKPQLAVTLVPEPQTWTLLAAGLLMLAGTAVARPNRRRMPISPRRAAPSGLAPWGGAAGPSGGM
jgi:hypothetical protein